MEVKRIITKKEQEKKTKRNQLIIGIILIGLMVLSTAGYSLMNNERSNTNTEETSFKYNGISFVKNGDYWQFNVNGNDFITKYNPKETSGIKVLGDTKTENFNNKALYFAGNDEVVSELARNLNYFALRIQKACLEAEECKEDFPVKDCNENIIVVKDASADNEESIYRINNCVYIVANTENQLKYSDAFLFSLLKI